MPDTVHACPPDGSGLTPCCRRNPSELPRTDRLTEDPDAVTCTSPWRILGANPDQPHRHDTGGAPDPALREAIAGAVRTVQIRLGPNALALAQRGEPIILNYGEAEALTTAVLAVIRPVLDELADYRNRITWETNCGEHARLLDSCRLAEERAEEAEARIARLRQMADAWEKQLPAVMRTATAVEAIRMAAGGRPGGGGGQ